MKNSSPVHIPHTQPLRSLQPHNHIRSTNTAHFTQLFRLIQLLTLKQSPPIPSICVPPFSSLPSRASPLPRSLLRSPTVRSRHHSLPQLLPLQLQPLLPRPPQSPALLHLPTLLHQYTLLHQSTQAALLHPLRLSAQSLQAPAPPSASLSRPAPPLSHLSQ